MSNTERVGIKLDNLTCTGKYPVRNRAWLPNTENIVVYAELWWNARLYLVLVLTGLFEILVISQSMISVVYCTIYTMTFSLGW
jgi:hypothetical protein